MRVTEATERFYVWEVPVRLTHWVNVLAITVLSVTGYYISNPIISGSVFLMGWMRAVHRIAAYTFVASLALRTYWAFAGNHWASWRTLAPFISRDGRQRLVEVLAFYLFLRRRPPRFLGHNPLAGLAYAFVVLMMFTEVATGFALLSLEKGGWWMTAFGWVFGLASLQTVRLTHHLLMWMLIGFTVHHVYSAILMDAEEKSGVLTSIFSGYKFGGRRA